MFSIYYKLLNRWTWYIFQLPFSATIPFLFHQHTDLYFFFSTETLVQGLKWVFFWPGFWRKWHLKQSCCLLVCDIVIYTDLSSLTGFSCILKRVDIKKYLVLKNFVKAGGWLDETWLLLAGGSLIFMFCLASQCKYRTGLKQHLGSLEYHEEESWGFKWHK